MKKVFVTGDTTLSFVGRALDKQLNLAQPAAPEWSVEVGGFNQWVQDILSPPSASTAPSHWICVLSPRLLSDSAEAESQVELFLNGAESRLREHPGLAILCTTLAVDPTLPQPLTETLALQSRAARLNERLQRFRAEHPTFHLIDQQAIFARQGIAKITEPRYEVLGRIYYSPDGAQALARELARALRALSKPAAKVLVLDLDNTLWGGILGEDGPEGIKVGGDGVGHAFWRFQKNVVRLRDNGILLALASKNNEADALAVFERHPDMLLRIKDFSAHRINWQPKAENLASMAQELNLGIDSFVFFDDSEFEREQMRQAEPKVRVVDVPKDPSLYVAALAGLDCFDVMRVTQEDRDRARQYAVEAERNQMRRSSGSMEEFYRSLEMKAVIARVDETSAARVHQLILKTNQFNLTTERFQEGDLRALIRNPEYEVITFRLSDKLGESGITGVVLIHRSREEWKIRNLLLSCRIIGRTAEFALLRWIAARAQAGGAKRLSARYVPSERNQVAADYLPKAGFAKDESDSSGHAWLLQLSDWESRLPKDYVQVEEQKP